jgi:hypothetical protein
MRKLKFRMRNLNYSFRLSRAREHCRRAMTAMTRARFPSPPGLFRSFAEHAGQLAPDAIAC